MTLIKNRLRLTGGALPLAPLRGLRQSWPVENTVLLLPPLRYPQFVNATGSLSGSRLESNLQLFLAAD